MARIVRRPKEGRRQTLVAIGDPVAVVGTQVDRTDRGVAVTVNGAGVNSRYQFRVDLTFSEWEQLDTTVRGYLKEYKNG